MIRLFLANLAMLVIGAINVIKIGVIDMHTIIATALVVTPAVIVLGFLGQKMGEILDNPKNIADADYKLAVLNALKKMDKSISLQELNEKLSKQVAEPDMPDITEDDVDE